MESKGECTWFQAGDLSGWDLAIMSKTSVLQVSGFFLLQHKGLRPDINCSCSCKKHKNRILFVQVKNKPCMVYSVMRLIPWKISHGRETITSIMGFPSQPINTAVIKVIMDITDITLSRLAELFLPIWTICLKIKTATECGIQSHS